MITTELAPSQKKMTVADYQSLPDGPPWVQLVDGQFYVSESPSSFHQEIVVKLCAMFWTWTKRTRSGHVRVAPLDVYLSNHDVVQPDLLYVSRQRQGIIQANGVHGAPDLAIEIISPSSVSLDKIKKRDLYARSGVRELWIVDPDLRVFEIHRLADGEPIQIRREGDRIVSAVLPDLEIEVSSIFQSEF